MTGYFVYRHFDKDGNLLYVGMSTDPHRRLKEHASRSEWYNEIANMTVSKRKFKTYWDALSAEARAIRKEKPKYNKTWNFFREKQIRYVDGGENDCNIRQALIAEVKVSSGRKMAKQFGVSAQYMCDVIRGNRAISEKIAQYFGFEKIEYSGVAAPVKVTPFMQFEDE